MNQEVLKLVVSAFFGGIVAALLTHALAIRRESSRDREQRKREFRGYLAELRSRIERIPHHQDKVRELLSEYTNLVHRFHSEKAKVMNDFTDRQEFLRLCQNFGSLRHHEITDDSSKRVPRDVLAEAIDALLRFSESDRAK